jgi:integrase/recombinase XerD
MNREGVTPALGYHQARMLPQAPPAETLKGERDRAILATPAWITGYGARSSAR